MKIETKMEWRKIRPSCINCKIPTTPAVMEEGGFEMRVWKCPKCKFTVTHPEDAEFFLMRQEGIKATISKIGRQIVLRIPARIRDSYHLEKIKEVLLKPLSNKEIELIIE